MTAQKLVLALSLLCVWLECEAKSFDGNVRKLDLGQHISAPRGEERQELFSGLLNVTLLPPVVPTDNFFIDGPQPKDLGNTNTRQVLACGDTISLQPGNVVAFESMNYPNQYPNSHTCVWKFKTGAADATLTVTCEPFSTETLRDTLTFIEPRLPKRRRNVARVSGSLKHFQMISSTNYVKATFKTNLSRASTGFSCTVSVTGTAAATTTTTTPATTTPAATTPATTTPAATTTTTTTTPTDNCECGKANTGSRIVGGTETLVNEYPWQVGVVRETDGVKNLICGGSIISNHWVLTAAHCIDSNAIEVLVGDHDFTTGTDTQDPAYLYAVDRKIVHADYVEAVNGFDIALLHTTQPLDFTKYGQAPVCLPPDKTRLYVGETATVSGWGTTSEGGSLSKTLQEVDVPVISNNDCQKNYNPTSSMLCAGEEGKDSCQGDSGGPLVYNNNGIYELIGVVSFGIGCARLGYLGVYTRVTSHVDWIQRYTGNLCTATSG